MGTKNSGSRRGNLKRDSDGGREAEIPGEEYRPGRRGRTEEIKLRKERDGLRRKGISSVYRV